MVNPTYLYISIVGADGLWAGAGGFGVLAVAGFFVFGETFGGEAGVAHAVFFFAGGPLGTDVGHLDEFADGLAGFGVVGEGIVTHFLNDFKHFAFAIALVGFFVFEDDLINIGGHGGTPRAGKRQIS